VRQRFRLFNERPKKRSAALLGVFRPVEEYRGRCIAVIRRNDDDDDKLVVVPEGVAYTKSRIIALTEYIERFHSIEVAI